MERYNYCLGIVLDGNYSEKTCPRRGNCVYYMEDIFTRFKPEQLADDFLLNEPGHACQYFVPRREIPKREEVDDPFKIE